LQETGAYEEALGLLLQAIELARPYPVKTFFYTLHLMLGSAYQALQQWEEVQAVFDIVETNIEAVTVEPLRIFLQSRLCMNAALTGQWEQAYHYATKAVTLRKRSKAAFMPLDFITQYETEALLRRGEERLAREEVQRRGEHLEPYTRFRLPYLQSLAVLATWDGQSEQAIDHLQEAAQLAAEIGLPGELWQIQARLGTLYQANGQQERADAAFGEAQSILQKLAENIADEALRAKFLAAPPVQRVRQHVQKRTSQTLYSKEIDQGTPRR
jgi:tetratricopeptide (TPR) repeat protein